MKRKNWAAIRPRNLTHAMELCMEHALAKYNRSTEGVCALAGVNSINTFYKYLATGGLPARLIKPFENACGIDYVSRWLVESSGKMVLDVPRGKKCGAGELNHLQTAYTAVIGELLKVYQELNEVEPALAALQGAMEQTAWHQGNVKKLMQPELPFDEED